MATLDAFCDTGIVKGSAERSNGRNTLASPPEMIISLLLSTIAALPSG
jgi:hypothetical protein